MNPEIAGSGSSSNPADSPIFIDLSKFDTGDKKVVFEGDGSNILLTLSLFLACGVWRIKSLGTTFFDDLNSFIFVFDVYHNAILTIIFSSSGIGKFSSKEKIIINLFEHDELFWAN